MLLAVLPVARRPCTLSWISAVGCRAFARSHAQRLIRRPTLVQVLTTFLFLGSTRVATLAPSAPETRDAPARGTSPVACGSPLVRWHGIVRHLRTPRGWQSLGSSIPLAPSPCGDDRRRRDAPQPRPHRFLDVQCTESERRRSPLGGHRLGDALADGASRFRLFGAELQESDLGNATRACMRRRRRRSWGTWTAS